MSKEWPLWEVFIRGQHGLNHRHVGSLHAPDAEMAINNARDVYTRRNEGVSIWVVPSAAITASSPLGEGSAVRAGQLQGLSAPDLLRHPRRSGAHVMPSLPDMTTPDVAELARDAAAHASHTEVPPPDAGQEAFFEFLLRIGDSTLILGHRVSEWCGHAPALEEDIALANVALDLIGQTQMWLGLAAEVEGKGRTADDLAYLRDAWDFRNLLLVERPNGDFGHTLMRQFLFDAYHFELLKALQRSTDPRRGRDRRQGREGGRLPPRALLATSSIRLGDGTDESHRRMQDALDALWPYTGEMFLADDKDAPVAAAGIAPDPASLRPAWEATVARRADRGDADDPESRLRPQGRQARHPYRASRPHPRRHAVPAARLSRRHLVGRRHDDRRAPSTAEVWDWLSHVPDPGDPGRSR